MDITPQARDRLAAEMEARRLDLGLSWRDIATRAGLSYEMVMKLRTRATSARTLTLRKADTGFSWEPGSIQRILNGGEPVPLAEPAGGELTAADEFERHVLAANLPDAEKRDAILRHRQQARAQLAELGLDENAIIVPDVIRAGIERLTRGGGADDGHGQAERRA